MNKWAWAITAMAILLLFGGFGVEMHANLTATEASCTSLGKILDAEVVPTAFNDCHKMQIKTERAVVVVRRLIYVPIGVEAFHVKTSDGLHWITWGEGGKLYRI